MSNLSGWIATITLGAMIIIGLTGCNTFRGAGKDIQRGGEAIEGAAENTQKEMSSSLPTVEHTIVASALSGGAITPGGGNAVATGTEHTFLISANSGYRVADVLVDGRSIGPVSRHTFEGVSANHSISARFTPVSSL